MALGEALINDLLSVVDNLVAAGRSRARGTRTKTKPRQGWITYKWCKLRRGN